MVDLLALFQAWNVQSFDSFLEPPLLTWNHRFRACAGRFIPGSRGFFRAQPGRPSQIEVASYFLSQDQAEGKVRDTLGHEMVHYWLWLRKRPYGHTAEFLAKIRQMGVSRYNLYPQGGLPAKYFYRCPQCARQFPTRRLWKQRYGCAACCRQHRKGRFSSDFLLEGPFDLVFDRVEKGAS